MIDHFQGEYRFLSNFHPVQHLPAATLEHCFQAAKTQDRAWREKILTAPTAKDSKVLGRQAPLRPDWESAKIPVMRQLLAAKFRPGDEISVRLLRTDPNILREGNTWNDRFWGVDLKTGSGDNWLGVLLMVRRAELRGS